MLCGGYEYYYCYVFNRGLGQKNINVAYFITIIQRVWCYTWNKDKRSIYVFNNLFSYLMLLIQMKNQPTKPPQTLIVV